MQAHRNENDETAHSLAMSENRRIESRIFPCTRCGACCRNLGKSPLFTQLDRGDGVCRHLNINTNLCGIYGTRPNICRVAEMFGTFKEHLAWQEYVELNQQACHELRALELSKQTNNVPTVNHPRGDQCVRAIPE